MNEDKAKTENTNCQPAAIPVPPKVDKASLEASKAIHNDAINKNKIVKK